MADPFAVPEPEEQYRLAQERLQSLERSPLGTEMPTAPRVSFLDHAAPYLAQGIRGFGPAVLPGRGHQLANIASVLAQGYLGGRASAAERMFEDYDRRRAEALASRKEERGRKDAEIRDARDVVRSAGSELSRWKRDSAVITPELAPFAPGFKAGERAPASIYSSAVSAYNKSKEPKEPKGGGSEPPKLNDYTGLLTAVRGDKDLQDFQTVRSYYSTIKTVGSQPSAAGDLALIFGFMKIVDPGSTVREGEQATAANARGVPAAIQAMYNRVLTGERLSADQRADFVSQSRNMYQSRRQQYDRAAGQYRRLAIKFGMDPDLVMRDLTADETSKPKPLGTRAFSRKTVTTPDGKTWQFNTPEEADAFRREAGL